MIHHVFILLPAPIPAGPVKGAYALANSLINDRPVTLVTLKPGPGADAPLDVRVRQVSLAALNGIRKKVRAYCELLEVTGGRTTTASISMCFSADMVNLFCRRRAVTCASVRGNLIRNYRMDYGLPGLPLAVAHLTSLRGMDHVVAMTDVMATQVAGFAGAHTSVIGNFVDEEALERFRISNRADGPLRFVFLGSLTLRKQPLLAIRAIERLRRRGVDAVLDVVGAGPLRSSLQAEALNLKVSDRTNFHGFSVNPYPLLAAADALVLPSLSEGVPRAALEALYLGVPCVLRAVDGNSELIRSGVNGSLFASNDELPDSMMEAAELSQRAGGGRGSLLPAGFRQRVATQAYLKLLENCE